MVCVCACMRTHMLAAGTLSICLAFWEAGLYVRGHGKTVDLVNAILSQNGWTTKECIVSLDLLIKDIFKHTHYISFSDPMKDYQM